MDSFVPLVAAIALMWKIVDFVKQVRVRDADAIVAQAATWGAGVAVTFLLAGSDFGDGIRVAHSLLGHLNAPSLVLVGLSLGSSASVAYDYKRAIDRNDSAAQPSIVTGLVPAVPPAVLDSQGDVAGSAAAATHRRRR